MRSSRTSVGIGRGTRVHAIKKERQTGIRKDSTPGVVTTAGFRFSLVGLGSESRLKFSVGRATDAPHGVILLFDLRFDLRQEQPGALVLLFVRKKRRRRDMFSGGRHWLDYDPVAFAVLVIGIGVLALIIFTI
jgi:hypothetical protein